MTRNRGLSIGAAFCVVALAACGQPGDQAAAAPEAGSGDPPPAAASPAFCQSLSGGSTQVASKANSQCTDCETQNAAAAIDGDFESYAAMTVSRVGALALRATAQPGIVFPAGNAAGVADGGIFDYAELTIRTFLSGALQESRVAVPGLYQPPPVFHGFKTTKPFDAVEVEFRFFAPATDNVTRDTSIHAIYEFCSDRPE